MFGEMIPMGGGDAIPLLKKKLLVGRRESCDIRLRFANVSAHHCELTLNDGYWYITDLKSRNGVKVNNARVEEKRIDPGDIVSIAKHRYEFQYSPYDLGAVGPPPVEEARPGHIFTKSLLERAGLTKAVKNIRDASQPKRYDPTDDQAGQIKDRNAPL